jgi:hypothetical protein
MQVISARHGLAAAVWAKRDRKNVVVMRQSDRRGGDAIGGDAPGQNGRLIEGPSGQPATVGAKDEKRVAAFEMPVEEFRFGDGRDGIQVPMERR